MNLKMIVLLICSSLVFSCTVRQPFEVYDGRIATGSDTGILVCSVAHTRYGIARPDPSYYIRRLGTKESIRIWGHNKLYEMTPDFTDDAGPGVVKVLQLPAGQYEIFTWGLFFNFGLSQWYESSKQPFSVPFEVKPNTLNYIGQLALTNYSLDFAERSGRDIKIAVSRMDSLQGLPVDKQDLKFVKGSGSEVQRSVETIQTPPIIHGK